MMTDDLVKRLRQPTGLNAVTQEPVQDKLNMAAADRIEELEAEVKSMAMDCLVAKGQASDAYQAQLLAEAKLQDQIHLIEQLFALLEITEQKEDGRYFHPTTIRSSRALDAEKLSKILAELKRSITANDKSDA
jgi:hypothetical protein